MSNRSLYSGADVYLGADEASALVGRWQHQAWGGPTLPRHRHHRHHFNQGGGRFFRDHRDRERAAYEWERRYPGVPFVGVEALMGAAEDGALDSAVQQLAPRAYLRDMPDPTMANRQVLPMNTGTTPVPINSTAQITSRPQRVAFRPERVFVSDADVGGGGSAANWIINDITIGNRSQFAQSGALPGDMFSNVAIDSFVTFETAQTAMDVVMIVTYQGGTEGGTPFYGAIIGTAAV